MKFRLQIFTAWLISLMLLANLPTAAFAQTVNASKQAATGSTPASSSPGWTLEEALGQLYTSPQDVYLQYVAMQLARRKDELAQIAGQVGSSLVSNGRREAVDLFSLFSGALAVQESLQLDTMTGETTTREVTLRAKPARWWDYKNTLGEENKQQEAEFKKQLAEWEKEKADYEERLRLRTLKTVNVASLTGPTIKSHPWEQMLAGRKTEPSPLSLCVPEDFYLAEFHSLTKLLEASETSDLWGTHLFNQAFREARTFNIGASLKAQLALETSSLLRPFYDLVVEDVAITGSDLFLREGSDVTLIFRYKQPEIFKTRMDGFLDSFEKKRPDAKRTTGNYLGVEYVQLTTPNRDLSVFSAWPAPGLHVRSNSRIALEKIIAAIQGKTADGKSVRRLGETSEFAYIRTLMPRGAKEEDGLIYLSDPFIRRLVGPQLKLTERRRMICYNHLRMIGHASLLYQTEFGKKPDSLATLAKTNCAPGVFGEEKLACPDGGKYTLSADGASGECSHHGHAQFMTPSLEIPVRQVSGLEAEEYKAFLDDYNQYWRTYFDPIAIRVQLTPQQYRLETIVLPLIDNSIYTGLASVLGGEPESLDALPVPQRNIFSAAVKINKDELLDKVMGEATGPDGKKQSLDDSIARALGLPNKDELKLQEFLSKGIGNQIGLHVYDSVPMFDLNLPSLLGAMLGSVNGSRLQYETSELMIGFAIAALNNPVYLAIPVKDAKIVDDFLDKLDYVLAGTALKKRRREWGLDYDFYQLPSSPQATRGYAVRFGPAKLRFFFARIGNGLYLASKPFIIDDLIAANAKGPADATDPAATEQVSGHAMLRLRPQNWNQVLPDYRLGWAENNREACLGNLSVIVGAGRALLAQSANSTASSDEQRGQAALNQADRFYAAHHFCPEGGHYLLSADGRFASCSVHGSMLSPRQPAVPVQGSDLGQLLNNFAGLTTTLSFSDEGLRAVMTIRRK